MAVSRLQTDPTTLSKLGPDLISDLKANLWPIDCQSCGARLGRWRTSALEVQAAEDGFATASLHHPRCRPPAWLDQPLSVSGSRASLSWRAGCMLLPPGDVPIFLVNPSYEYALLRQVDGKEWRIATLDPFVSLGFARDFPSQSVPPVPALAAMIDGDRISVAVRHEGAVMHSWHNIPIAPEISTVVREWEHIMVAVTTLLDVRKPIPLDLLRTLIGARKVALGPARLTSVRFSEHAQALKPGDFAETPSAFRT